MNLFHLLLFLLSLKICSSRETVLEGVVALSQALHRDHLLDPADFLLEDADTFSALISDIADACLKVVT